MHNVVHLSTFISILNSNICRYFIYSIWNSFTHAHTQRERDSIYRFSNAFCGRLRCIYLLSFDFLFMRESEQLTRTRKTIRNCFRCREPSFGVNTKCAHATVPCGKKASESIKAFGMRLNIHEKERKRKINCELNSLLHACMSKSGRVLVGILLGSAACFRSGLCEIKWKICFAPAQSQLKQKSFLMLRWRL